MTERGRQTEAWERRHRRPQAALGETIAGEIGRDRRRTAVAELRRAAATATGPRDPGRVAVRILCCRVLCSVSATVVYGLLSKPVVRRNCNPAPPSNYLSRLPPAAAAAAAAAAAVPARPGQSALCRFLRNSA